MFKLHPSEEMVLEVKSDVSLKARKKSRYLLVLAFILLAVALFYRFASKQDDILLAVFWISLVGSILSSIAYISALSKAKKTEEAKTYYITSTRVVEVDANGELVRDILRNRIKRVEVELISGKAGDVLINPRELSAEKKYKKELKGEQGNLYSKDTFIINSVQNANEFASLLK